MDIEELDLPGEAIDALRQQGYVRLHPPQAEAIPKALEGRNLVVAVPTASGKSLIGYAAAIKTISEKGRKVLYIVPLKALAAEKKDDMDRFSNLGIKTAMSIGDLDSDEGWMKNADFIVATSEKADSLIRHRSKIMDDIGLVIADEIHLIHDPSRGPTLEVALTKIKRRNSDVQIIALSATIPNARDMAMWLDADLIQMDWRPIPLYEGVYYNNEVTFDDGHSVDIEPTGDDIWSLMKPTLMDGGQCIIFVNSRRSTEALANKYSPMMSKLAGRTLTSEETAVIEGDGDATSMGRKLSSCIAAGMAFHNAGLTSRQRSYVEENFRNGNIKCIVATPTLAAGINLPARRVIIRDTKRFESNSGNTPIPVMEIKQMCGRAGRPGYDPYGEAILIAKNYDDYEHLMNDYVQCDPENVMSKLGNESVLRNHILGLIATEDATSAEGIIDFIRDTFYGIESQLYGIESAVENVVDFLQEHEMVFTDGDVIVATSFGKRVSDLYIDPKSAVILKDSLERMNEFTEDFPILYAIASTPDVLSMYPRKSDESVLMALSEEWGERFLTDIPDDSDYGYEYFLGDLKTAYLVQQWIEEVNDEDITKSFGIGPGDIRSRVDMADWLIYAMSEIAVLFHPNVVKRLRKLLVRVRYGVSEELTELVSFKGIGRMRARILYDRGIKNRSAVEAMDVNDLASIPGIGPALARKLKGQTDNPPDQEKYQPKIEEERIAPAPAGPRQSKLFDF